ncbi:TRAF3-interacting protein 1 [Chamberlinius hualienensis]
MAEELDAKVIKETQETLGKFVKKPPLNEKLLRKPPFKFLHDVLTSVITNTGFMKDVFTADELNSETIKDRESKIAFLQKAVDFVVTVTNEPLKIRPSKTVAGQEADKTNQFLQALAKAIQLRSQNGHKSDSAEVKTSRSSSQSRKAEDNKSSEKSKEKPKSRTSVDEPQKRDKKSSEKTSNSSKTNGEVKKSADKDNKKHGKQIKDAEKMKSSVKDKSSRKTSDVKGTESSRDKSKERIRTKDEEVKPTKSKDSKVKPSSSRRSSVTTIKPTNDEKSKIPSPNSSPEKKHLNGVISKEKTMIVGEVQEVEDKINAEPEKMKEKDFEMMSNQTKNDESGRAATARLSRSDTMTLLDSTLDTKSEPESLTENTAVVPRPSTSTLRKASARPSTARPAAPRVRVIDTAPEEIQSLPNAKPVGGIILDGETVKDDEVELPMDEFSNIKDETPISLSDLENKTHGSLVTQILETKRDLENGSRISESNVNLKQESKTVLSDSARRKEREMLTREMEKLKDGVQKVTRSANPLGKLIGYLQEDVEIMMRESEMWRLESERLQADLIREESKSDIELDKLQNQIQELEEMIEAQISEIFSCKSRILRNNEFIHQMISTCV